MKIPFSLTKAIRHSYEFKMCKQKLHLFFVHHEIVAILGGNGDGSRVMGKKKFGHSSCLKKATQFGKNNKTTKPGYGPSLFNEIFYIIIDKKNFSEAWH